jgi:hypothetical protein
MAGRTDFITEARWEDVWLIWYTLVDDAYQSLEKHYGAWRRTGPNPRFSDSEVITISLIIDTWFAGHEALGLSFLRQYHASMFPRLPANGWFNQRRTKLCLLIEQIRQVLNQQYGLVSTDDSVRLIDSAPVFVATYTRGQRNQTLQGKEYFGIAKSKGAKVFGIRLHITSTVDQVVDTWLLAPASVHDSTPMAAILEQSHDLLVLGDGAFHKPVLESVLREKHAIQILKPPRKNNRNQEPWPEEKQRWIGRVRRRVETTFSVLQTVFRIEQPAARSLPGLIARISTRILAYNLCFVTQFFLGQLTSIQTPN